jgi:U-box domain
MIKTGEISDLNYTTDQSGELRYLFGKKEGGEGFVRNFARTGHAAAQREETKKTKKRKRNPGAQEEEDAAFTCPGIYHIPQVEGINPIPEFIDAITLEEVKKPAISPYGHVLGYETWSRCLSREPKNICPLTKKPLSHRELVILTIDNIEMYR